jgi:hypothetical protein
MKPALARLVLTIALFAGWLGYLGYLVVCRPHTPEGLRGAFDGRPLTLSRPQIFVSMLDVVAQVDNIDGKNVLIKEVLYPSTKPPVQSGDRIDVENIERCHPLPDPMAKEVEPPPDFTGAGEYILPLEIIEMDGKRRFQVVPTPPSPGFPPPLLGNIGPPRIYPATPEMRAEYKQIAKPQ